MAFLDPHLLFPYHKLSRRRELLSRIGIPFETDPADVSEITDLPADAAVAELSRRKAEASCIVHPGRWILAADTLVSADGRILSYSGTRT